MGTATVGTIGLNMVLNSAGFRRSLQNVQSQANTASQKMAASFKKIGAVIATAFSAKMIASFGKSCMDLGSDLAEVQNVVDVTFSSMSDSVNKWSQNAAKSYGLSETMAKKYVGLYGSMAEAFGFTEQQAYDMSTTLTGLAGDVASFYNLDQDLAYTKLKSVFSGETETLKDLGIVMTQSALDNYALANGYGKTVSQMTEAEKVTLRYNFVLGQLKNATGDFTRTQDSWANQTRILKLNFDSLKASIGQGLITAFTPLLKMLNQLIEKAKELSSTFSSAVSSLFGTTLANNSNATGTAVEALTNDANNSAAALDNITDSAEKAKRSVAGFDKLNIITQDTSTKTNASNNNDSTTVSNGKNSPLVTAMDNLTSSWNAKSKKLLDSVKGTMGKIKTAISEVGKSWSRVWNNGTGQKFLDNIKNLISDIIDNVGSVADAFTKAWNKAGLGDSVIQSFIDKANSLIELIDVIAVDFGEVWNNGTGERIWGNILSIIRNCNNATKTLRDKIKEAWEKNDTGKKLWGDILGIVEDITGFLNDMSEIHIEWLENLDLSPLMTGVEKLAGAFRELLKACGDKLKTVYKNILLPLAKWTIEKGVPKLVEMLAKALKAISNAVKNISDKTLYAIAGGIAAVATAVIAFKAGQAIANGIAKVKNAIKLFTTTISANPLLAIAGAISGIVLAVETYGALKWENSEAKKFADEIDSIKSDLEATTSGIEDNLKSTLDSLDNMYADNTLVDNYQEKLMELLEKAKLDPSEQAQLQTIVTYFSNNIDGFDDTWNKYVSISGNGKINLKGDLTEIQREINNTIDEYQKLANMSALSDLKTENAKEQIAASKELNSSRNNLSKKQEELNKAEEEFNSYLEEHNLTAEKYKQLYNSDNGDYYRKTGGDYYDKVVAGKEALEEAKDTYNESVAEMNKLIMTGDDLSDVYNVLNGDFSDSAAVMMAYNSSMISLQDVQESEWKSINNLEKAAKNTGKNTVVGLVEGTEEYKGALIENSNGLANLVLSEYDRTMDIHSPSREMHKRGVWTVEGLANGVTDSVEMLKNPLQTITEKFQKTWQRIKGVFTDGDGFVKIKDAIWSVFKNAINALISGINSLIRKPFDMLNGAFDDVRNFEFFGQKVFDWLPKIEAPQIPKLAKGGIVKAPTLAVVGDNAGANTGNPEVIAPLNKLQNMINASSGQDVVILGQILDYLKRIYEMFVVFRNNGGNMYEFVAKLNGSTLFAEIVNQNELYKKRHNGKSAFL